MVRRGVATAVILVLAWGLGAALYAGGAEQKILTQKDVDRILEVFPGYVGRIKESNPGLRVVETQHNPTAWLILGMFQNGASDYIQGQGWNFQDFAVTAGSLFQAYAHIESRPGNKAGLAPEEDGRQKKSSPDDMKQAPFSDQAIQKPRGRQGSQSGPKVPDANLEIARKNQERIRTMLSTIP